ncbi:MAG: metal ABC transporter substrate-binding protein [Huintestinicola sp.]
MKKILSAIMAAALICTMTACGNNEKDNIISNETGNAKLSIVCTIFPEYDWVRELTAGSDNTEITLLLDNGVDLHSFQPTADDIIRISTCDMFIYVGGESDEWVEDVLDDSNKNMVIIDLLEVLGDSVKEEEIKEGMESDHDHDNDLDHDNDHEEESEYDEHIWLSLRNADAVCKYISAKLGETDPENKSLYDSNYAAYSEKLNALDKLYSDAVSAGTKKALLFGDRFPFRYMTDDYGLDYYAAFAGCSAETEASFETIAFLAGKTDELGLECIMTIEGKEHKIAETIAQNTSSGSKKILALDSMQGTASEDVNNGKTYLAVMESNLAVLKEALA